MFEEIITFLGGVCLGISLSLIYDGIHNKKGDKK